MSKKHHRNKSGGKKKKKTAYEATPDKYIIQLFKDNQGKGYTYNRLLKKCSHKYKDDETRAALDMLIANGTLKKIDNERLVYPQNLKKSNDLKGAVVEGSIDISGSGTAFLVSPDLARDAFVSSRRLNTALDGDKVLARIINSKGRPEAEIIKVIKRKKDTFIGTIELSENFAFCVPLDLNMSTDIFIPISKVNKAQNGQMAVVKIVKWDNDQKNPVGEVIELLGKADVSDIVMKSIILDNGFNLNFPDEVLAESKKIKEEIGENEIANRLDLRDVLTFTIDPEDAKDFDDAISYRVLTNGNTEIGVHIADVTHYVRPNTALDKEAYERSTSVYLPDRVCPMLPEKISNELCSLRPNEDKLTFSVLFELNHRCKIVNTTYAKTIIHSNRRFTYEEAQAVLETKKGDFVNELTHVNEIAIHFRNQRFKEGAVAFESNEVRFKLDEKGKPIEVKVKVRKDAHMLIEDLMLLANKAVSKYVSKLRMDKLPYPMIYRVHDQPDLTKLETFSQVAARFGYEIKFKDTHDVSAVLNTFFEKIKGRNEEHILVQLAIRSMAKAVYSAKNIGHYGLAFEYYSHFTSPIRRYADVIAHRILESCLNHDKIHFSVDELQEECNHISEMERQAQQAEREGIKYKQCEYLSEKIGEEFEGMITGLIGRGIFVELTENYCEGFVPSLALGDEDFLFDDKKMLFVGLRSGKRFGLGDKIKIKVADVSLEKRQIEFVLAEQ